MGDFSGLQNNLKDGLLELGHEAMLASRSDGFKKIPSDYSLESRFSGLLGHIDSAYYKPFSITKFVSKADIVQLINPFYFNRRFFPHKFFFNYIRSLSKKFFFLAAGDDAYYWQIGRERLRYGPFDDILKYDLNSIQHEYESRDALLFNKHVLEKSNGVIPIMYDYELGYKNSHKRLGTIPLPVNTSKIKYHDNKANKKLSIFHGLNRYGFKGTKYVEEAFLYLKNKYPNDLELIIDGKMSIDKYLELMNKANVVIDQTSSHSLGMNALYAMAMGKVVLGGAEIESFSSLGISTSPVINILPNSESIISAVELLLSQKNNIGKLGYESRAYVENNHNYIKIAQKYLNTWSSN